ncbi:MAG: STAS domain-containing protein [Bacteroidota bacterium]
MNVNYSITEHDSVQVLFTNTLLDEWQNRQILQDLRQKIDNGAKQFVVDLAAQKLMNSIGLNFLLTLFSCTKKTGGALILANPSKKVRQVLEMTKLSNVFKTETSVETAVNQLNAQLV